MHNVYVGTSFADVNSATDPNAAPGRGQQSGTSYDTTSLNFQLTNTYYWRIDEVNGASEWKGDVWSFTVAPYVVIDALDYDSLSQLDDAWSDIWVNGTSAEMSVATTPAESGNSMKVIYNNASYGSPSEVDCDVTDPVINVTDWTNTGAGGAKALPIGFYGDAGNSPSDQLYVRVTSADNSTTTINYDGASTDITEESWHNGADDGWWIDVNDLADAGVDTFDVKELTIGISGTSDGVVYIDNVVLAIPFCRYPSQVNFSEIIDGTGDCVVNMSDLSYIADNWLLRPLW
jgi:hypothetical protein